ncbi:MAG TPA: hypothetical protein VKZ53_04575 [Candidatus Angelobacter sp.]|nr:hypothetical protein [Candidatus Angelobacter sp.]
MATALPPDQPDLGSEDFKRLLKRLDPDEAEAAKQYGSLRDKLVRHCFKNHAFREADEVADQALDILAKRISSEEIQKIESYAFKILANLLANHRRRRPIVALPENMAGSDNPEQKVMHKLDGERKVACFLRCISRLKPVEQWLIREYYPDESCNLEERRRRITARLDIDPGTLMTRMNRLRTKLEKCCKDCYA